MATKSISSRAERFWKRMGEWYGAKLGDQYSTMPTDWADLIDSADDNTVRLVMTSIREKHVTFPPTFPELASLFAKSRPSSSSIDDRESVQEQLHDFVVKHYGSRLTPMQLRGPWTYLGRFFDAPGLDGKMRHNHGVEFTGVVVPADAANNAPSIRVMVDDMRMESAA